VQNKSRSKGAVVRNLAEKNGGGFPGAGQGRRRAVGPYTKTRLCARENMKKRRRLTSFGKPGAWRVQKRGGDQNKSQTLEWREHRAGLAGKPEGKETFATGGKPSSCQTECRRRRGKVQEKVSLPW